MAFVNGCMYIHWVDMTAQVRTKRLLKYANCIPLVSFTAFKVARACSSQVQHVSAPVRSSICELLPKVAEGAVRS